LLTLEHAANSEQTEAAITRRYGFIMKVSLWCYSFDGAMGSPPFATAHIGTKRPDMLTA
jgi:hypothetical protein